MKSVVDKNQVHGSGLERESLNIGDDRIQRKPCSPSAFRSPFARTGRQIRGDHPNALAREKFGIHARPPAYCEPYCATGKDRSEVIEAGELLLNAPSIKPGRSSRPPNLELIVLVFVEESRLPSLVIVGTDNKDWHPILNRIGTALFATSS